MVKVKGLLPLPFSPELAASKQIIFNILASCVPLETKVGPHTPPRQSTLQGFCIFESVMHDETILTGVEIFPMKRWELSGFSNVWHQWK